MTSSTSSQERTYDKGRYQVRLPVFISEADEVGLGDVIKRMTTKLGMAPCGGCARRARALNQLVTISRRRRV